MPIRAVLVIAALALLAGVARPLGQEGHPLTGTWSGDWGPSPTDRRRVTLVMTWDGKTVTGIINPGPDAIPLKSVFLDVTNWQVRIEAEAKDGKGAAVTIAAEGRLEDLGSSHRRLIGTWTQQGTKGDLRLTRD